MLRAKSFDSSGDNYIEELKLIIKSTDHNDPVFVQYVTFVVRKEKEVHPEDKTARRRAILKALGRYVREIETRYLKGDANQSEPSNEGK